MQWPDVPSRPSNRLLRQFAGLWMLFFGSLAGAQWWHGQSLTAALLAGLALVVGGAGTVRPALIRPIFVAWIVLAFPVGWLIFNGCLAVIFFGLLTPLALLFRLAGRDALHLKPAPEAQTYLHAKPSAPPASYYRTF